MELDETFGWGAVDVGAGIATIQMMKTAKSQGLPAVRLSELRRGLPDSFSHLRDRLDGVEIALQVTDRSYYNMPLTAVLTSAIDSSQTSSGDAAKNLMTADFVAGDSFRFWGGVDVADNASRFISEYDGAFGAADSSDASGYVRWTTAEYGNFSMFGEYEYADIRAKYGGDSLIAAVRNARAEGWTAGMQLSSVWKFGDWLRVSAAEDAAISGGEMILRYPVAEGDSRAAFFGEEEQTIRIAETAIPLKAKSEIVYAFGYGQKFDGERGEWSAAAEWNSRTDAAAFSARLQIAF